MKAGTYSLVRFYWHDEQFGLVFDIVGVAPLHVDWKLIQEKITENRKRIESV